jgi:hypothetical protein
MKKIILLLSIPAMIAAFSGCSKSSSSPSTNASVMFVHGCASGTTAINLEAYDNGVAVNGATNIAFLANSGYQNIKAGTDVLSFNVTGLGGLDTGTVTLTAGSSYSAFSGGEITAPVFVLTSDDLSAPAAGYAKVRFINLSPDNMNTNCYVGTTQLDSGLAYKNYSSFYQVAAGTLKVEMYDQSIPVNSAAIATQTLAAGKIYTFMFTGTAAATTGLSVLTLTAISNN